MLKGTGIDIAVIIFYFTAILAFGTWFGRFTKTTKDFFFGGQRFSWWLIAFSCIATVVGSYSFIKYSTAGYKYGFSSTMTYLNDWFIIPLFVLGWLPILYFSRVTSIPEYFERRFDAKTRKAGVVLLMLYLVGYIGINLYTIGVAFNSMLGWDIMTSALVITIVCAVYMHAGGQTSVIMTDLAQSLILLFAGLLVFVLGLMRIGGGAEFLSSLDSTFKLPFSGFNAPPDFSSVGIFWQDAFGSSLAFYCLNQGVIMRFLSVKSVREGKKAIYFVVIVLMPLAAFSVSNAGWIGRSMVNLGILSGDIDPNHVFVEVANLVAVPGLFGFIMAALTAALMSTVDTLINAVSAIMVNDIVRPLRPGREDGYYLRWARFIAIVAAAAGLALVPVFAGFKSIYVAHGAFTAAITPPMIVVVILGVFWKRFTPAAAFATLTGGTLMVALSIQWPVLISPFDHGVDVAGYQFMRALYGLAASLVIASGVSFISAPRKPGEIEGLVIDSLDAARKKFKNGREPNEKNPGVKIKAAYRFEDIEGVSLSEKDMAKLGASPGDIIYISDTRWWTGGLISITLDAAEPHREDGIIRLSLKNFEEGRFRKNHQLSAEKII